MNIKPIVFLSIALPLIAFADEPNLTDTITQKSTKISIFTDNNQVRNNLHENKYAYMITERIDFANNTYAIGGVSYFNNKKTGYYAAAGYKIPRESYDFYAEASYSQGYDEQQDIQRKADYNVGATYHFKYASPYAEIKDFFGNRQVTAKIGSVFPLTEKLSLDIGYQYQIDSRDNNLMLGVILVN